MLLNRKSVELLAPAGTWDALVAGVESGADAVYLGGKHFNMRMHEGEFNFDDALLKKAIDYAHEHGVRLYITLNNLISNEEIPALREYLAYLNEIRPDALLVQDFAVLELVHEMGITIPLHTSVMMNTHNEHAIEKLKEYGITRIVVGREMTLSELSLFRERTGIEVEYFMHGDMCISESGQCIHSGVLFGQSGNRGRCLKPCRWAYKLIDEKTGEVLDKDGPGAYKLALKDMCMYRAIPQLIQAGVFSFKIEGRMRPAGFIRRIVSTYRKAIDAYIADPNGYTTDEEGRRSTTTARAISRRRSPSASRARKTSASRESANPVSSATLSKKQASRTRYCARNAISRKKMPRTARSASASTRWSRPKPPSTTAQTRSTSAARHSVRCARGSSATTQRFSPTPREKRALSSRHRARRCAVSAASSSSSSPLSGPSARTA